MTKIEMNIKEVKAYAEEIAGYWNGDEAGISEDRAMIANEIIDKCSEIEELLHEL